MPISLPSRFIAWSLNDARTRLCPWCAEHLAHVFRQAGMEDAKADEACITDTE